MTELERIRHSAAHVLATAILKIWPDAQFAAGPPVENGFYYDVELGHRISPEDFPRIEEEMKREVKANHVFERVEISRPDALAMAERGELAALSARGVASKFKLDILQNIPEGEAITLFRNGEFTDLCAGPHVMRTGNIGAFKLTHVASAYYKGDERNPQLQRIYGTAFKNKTAMDEYFAMLEEAKKRDHRKIGAEMGLYAIDSEFVGPGMPLWLPKGAVLVEELERLAKETEFAAGYVRVRTPHLAKEKMYKTSGHLPYYAESMFPPMELKEHGEGEGTERYYLKAMNCPHHHRIFAAEPKSYRDLPLRLAEYGCCYRYEQSGELFGLMRVRSLNMNDAHIYCTEAQFAEEFRAVNEMYLRYFGIFGLEKYQMRFSTHDPAKLGQKFVDEPELWRKTEDMVRQVLVGSGINFVEVPNEAAFYGPKIDVQVWSAIGREFTIATNQVDFAVPAKFGLRYRDRDNSEKVPLCIHRAPLGTHERFIGFLIEHYAGNFPLWLAPEQVRIVTLNDDPALVEYATGILKKLRGEMVRAEADFGTDPVKAKIAEAEKARVHTMLVVGPRDMEAGNVSVRLHGKGNLGAKPKDEVVAGILESIRERKG
ncbi:MAG: threonine--tRNA ligase [Verrucomicrobia bacterium]|nr:threonine--tRNA ligase [Verrucomicrobiota bacterium]